MTGNRGRNYHNRRGGKHFMGEKPPSVLEHINENNPTMQLFQQYGHQLDDKHDRFERVVKINRDITIESKRIIFLLHNTATDIDGKKEQIFKDAESRLNELLKHFKRIALELNGHDHFLYIRAYTSCLQEYIEAVSFFEYQRYGAVPKIEDMLQKFRFVDDNDANEISLECPLVEIMLGLSDFTGEMMRKCINNLGAGNLEDCFKTCGFVRCIYVGFLGLNTVGHNIIGRKLHVLRQSLSKMELVCYNIRVRGSEIPKHMLASVVTATEENLDDDEGFF